MQLPKMSTDKPAVRSSSSAAEACCNHLQQKFNQKAPNLVWVSDITYIKAGGIWYYLCIVMDLFSRKVIAWHISSKANVDLVITAFKKAYEKRNAPYGLMFHSDRGSQYTAFTFRQLLDSLNVVQSFSKKGYPFDNACCECFFKYLKKEETNRKCYHSLKLSILVDTFFARIFLSNISSPEGADLKPLRSVATRWFQIAPPTAPSISGNSLDRKFIPASLFHRRKTSISSTDSAIIPIAHKIAPDNRFQFFYS